MENNPHPCSSRSNENNVTRNRVLDLKGDKCMHFERLICFNNKKAS